MILCLQSGCHFCQKDYLGNLGCKHEQPVLRINSTVTHPNVLQCVTYAKRTRPMPVDLRGPDGLYPGQIKPPSEDVEDEKSAEECDT